MASASDEELLAIYPHGSDVPRDAWQQLFRTAEREIGVLVFSGLWLPEDAGLLRTLVDKAKAGVRVRVLLGDPESSEVAARGADEGLDDAMSAPIRNAFILYRPLRAVENAEFRFHATVLYNSIYRSDDEPWSIPTSTGSLPRTPPSGTCARWPAARSQARTWRASSESGKPQHRAQGR